MQMCAQQEEVVVESKNVCVCAVGLMVKGYWLSIKQKKSNQSKTIAYTHTVELSVTHTRTLTLRDIIKLFQFTVIVIATIVIAVVATTSVGSTIAVTVVVVIVSEVMVNVSQLTTAGTVSDIAVVQDLFRRRGCRRRRV